MGDDKRTITASEVADYLLQNPDFLVQHEALLETIQLASSPEGTISLAQRQTQRLMDKNTQLQEQLRTLIDNARQNNELQTRVHLLCLKLMDTNQVDELLPLLVNELKLEFQADELALRLFHHSDSVLTLPDTGQNIKQLQRDDPSLKAFDSMLGKSKPICGRLSEAQKKVLFGADYEAVKSVACLPLGSLPCAGILAIASFDENRFHADMATDYLSFLGEVIMRLLTPFTHHHEDN